MIKNIVLKLVCLILLLLVFGCDWLYNPKDYRLFPGNYGHLTTGKVTENSFELSWSKAFIGEGEYGFDSAESYPDGVTYSIYLTSDLVDKDSIQTSSRLVKQEIDIVNSTLDGLEPGTIYFYYVTAKYKSKDKVEYFLGTVQTLTEDGSDPDKDDDTIDKATFALTDGSKIEGEFNGNSDTDYYKFTAKAGTIYNVSTNNVSYKVIDENEVVILEETWSTFVRGQFYIPYDGVFFLKMYQVYNSPFPYWVLLEETGSMQKTLDDQWIEVTAESNKFKTFYTDNASKDILLLEWKYKIPSDDSEITIFTSTHDISSHLGHDGFGDFSGLILPTKGYNYLFTEIISYKESELISGKLRINKISDESIKNIPLSEWVPDDFNGKEYVIYSAEVKQNTKYNIYRDDSFEGSDKYSSEIYVTCYGKNNLNYYFESLLSGYSKPKEVYTEDETNIILVVKNSNINNGETFAVKVEEVIE